MKVLIIMGLEYFIFPVAMYFVDNHNDSGSPLSECNTVICLKMLNNSCSQYFEYYTNPSGWIGMVSPNIFGDVRAVYLSELNQRVTLVKFNTLNSMKQ